MKHEVEITSLANGGDGVCRVDGQVCFVPYALPGDRVTIDIEAKTHGVLRGTIQELLESSTHRSEAPCSVFGKCGGCTWLHFDYPAQAEWKCKIVRDCFSRIGKLDVEVAWVDDETLRMGYRTRATFRGDGSRWGFYEARSHDVVDIQECPLCHPKLNAAFQALRSTTVNGQVEIAVNPEGDEVLVWSKRSHSVLKELFPLADARDDGGRRSSFLFDGVPIVNGSFAQSSLPLNRILVQQVHGLVGNALSILDLYCGTGNFSQSLAERMRVVGLDHDGAAIMAAGQTRRGEYRIGDEEEFTAHISARAWDVILLDPPRAGAKRIMTALAGSDAGTIIYVSCDPGTLARDAAMMVRAGWSIEGVTAVDMFPQTSHIECVAHFVRT